MNQLHYAALLPRGIFPTASADTSQESGSVFQHVIYCSLPARASRRLWQQPLRIALMGELGTRADSKDGLTLCQKTLTRLLLSRLRLPQGFLFFCVFFFLLRRAKQESTMAEDNGD